MNHFPVRGEAFISWHVWTPSRWEVMFTRSGHSPPSERRRPEEAPDSHEVGDIPCDSIQTAVAN